LAGSKVVVDRLHLGLRMLVAGGLQFFPGARGACRRCNGFDAAHLQLVIRAEMALQGDLHLLSRVNLGLGQVSSMLVVAERKNEKG